MYRLLFVLVIASFVVDAKHLPSYIKPCKKADPNFKACVKQHAIDALPSVLKGDKEYKNPSLLPLRIPLINLNPGDNLSLKLKDAVIRGFENAVIEDIDFDLEKKHIYTKFSFKWINIEGQYEIDGKILVLPLKGSGPANITCENLVVEYSFDFTLQKHDDGKDYFNPDIKPVMSYTIDKNQFYFGNLFNGDKNLGEKTNEFLNEHGAELHEELSASFSETINLVVTNILKTLFPLVPFEEIFA